MKTATSILRQISKPITHLIPLPHLNHLYPLFLLFVIFIFSFHPTTDPDLGWHLATGRFFAQNKQLPQNDPFSYSLPQHPFIAHSWLSDTILFFTHQTFGFLGITTLFSLALTLAIFSVLPVKKLKPVHLPLLILVLITTNLVVGHRSQLISFIMLLLSLRLVHRQQLVFLPPLFLLWANLHGGFVYGLLITSTYILFSGQTKHPSQDHRVSHFPQDHQTNSLNLPGTSFALLVNLPGIAWLKAKSSRGEKTKSAKLVPGLNVANTTSRVKTLQKLILILSCFLATLINPYFFKPHLLSLQMATNPISATHNLDWMSPLSPSMTQFGKITTILVMLIVVFSTTLSRPNAPQIILSLALSLASLSSARYLLPLLATNIHHLLFQPTKLAKFLKHRLSRFNLLIVLSFTPVIIFQTILSLQTFKHPSTYLDYSPTLPNPNTQFPHQAVEFIKKNPNLIGTNIFNPYNWGGFLIWNLPNHKFFIDGRMDNFYIDNQSFLAIYNQIRSLDPNWLHVFQTYPHQAILLPLDHPIISQLTFNNWTQIYQDSLCVILTPLNPPVQNSIHHKATTDSSINTN